MGRLEFLWADYYTKIFCFCVHGTVELRTLYIQELPYALVNSSWAQPPPPPTPGYCGAFSRLVSPGGEALAKFVLPGGWAFANPEAILELLTRTRFPIRIWLHRGFYWERKQIGSSVKDRKKLKRVVKAILFLILCISSLLIKPELHSEIGSYRRESTFFGYWIKFLLILFEEHPFIFIKLFITYNFTALY